MSDKREPSLVEDLGGRIKLYSDGSVVRNEEEEAATDNYKSVLYRDIVFDDQLGLWARVYLPPEPKTKMAAAAPMLLYFHGGGFCFLNPASAVTHSMCQKWAATLGVIIVSVNYRLAPEHRLPAAYHDGIAALRWIQSMNQNGGAADPWFHSRADFSKVFLAGESAGANIAHRVGIWAANGGGGGDVEIEIEIKGMILMYPYFGGEERTPSESLRSPVFNVEMSDAMWRLALPLGSNRDHPFCNPMAEDPAACRIVLPPMIFAIGGRDILKDKQLQYCEVLKKSGQRIEVHMFEEEDHGFTLLKLEDQSSLQILRCISDFIK